MAETDSGGSAATTKRNSRRLCRKGRGGSRNFLFGEGGGGGNFSSERDFELFLWQITSHKDNHVFLNQWTPVEVVAGKAVLRAEVNRS